MRIFLNGDALEIVDFERIFEFYQFFADENGSGLDFSAEPISAGLIRYPTERSGAPERSHHHCSMPRSPLLEILGGK
jgi:hypothetical protein